MKPYAFGGCKWLGVPALQFCDGSRGVISGHCTCFPVSMTRGATFDKELEYQVGLALDTFAPGLLNPAKVIEDGRLDALVRERYASYESGIGRRIVEGRANLAELAGYVADLGIPALPGSGNHEGLQSIINQLLFGGV